MDQQTCLLLTLPNDIIGVLCTYLKFSTSLFLTCKTLCAQQLLYIVLCGSGNHFVKLINNMKRVMPTKCPCIQHNECEVCHCVVIPAFIPTRFKYSHLFTNEKFICDTCATPDYDTITFSFKVGVSGSILVYGLYHLS